jgi:peroxiredoxin
LLAVDVKEKAHKVRSFARDQGLSFPILLDSNGAVASMYGIRAHPVAYLIDIESNVIGVAHGYRKWDRKEMKALIRSLLPKR